ncbi:formate dehydrogenase subunit gamma [Tropicibacter naphthalenivorans]|uniref:Formate dehydrogenase-O subunit gamma n=1 Tax=Tropicibacter naphthalenivorans TaxID=441103 RepID=A0A0P1GGX1_9RHOB|nr:formate dehydrogenase subunit gamma [Tropicibacter naphthalenivorans]CUH80759.1 Formate dehydrogenase-O subunit gamma [Tropicibacter naphthalenivorans]SMC90084.1 formate dehydrogenase gamma subunit [Tropicibacter naphthalenivorans]
MLRHLMALLTCILLTAPGLGHAQDTDAPAIDRSATGGAQTLEDILRRQEGQAIDDSFRSDAIGGDAISAPGLGPLGGASDPELWRALRYNKADVTVSTRSDVGKVLVQDGGMRWYEFRKGPLATYGGWLLLGTIGFLVVFYLLRGRIGIDGGKAGSTVTRFQFFERFSHWLLAGSFILLAVTGLLTLFGRMFIAPYLGKDLNATLLTASKFIHNNVAWAFILGLIFVFFLWVWHNIPNKLDLIWFKQAGGIIGNAHPPAKKFNAGQKIIFWSVIVLGGSIAVSGLSLLFPFQMPLFGHTFGILNDLGVPGWFDMAALPTELAPQEEMQLAQLWHAIVAFVLMAIIIAHIYIGSVGMEGAYDAMGSGQVDEAWAHQHHSIWLEEIKAKEGKASDQATPAE